MNRVSNLIYATLGAIFVSTLPSYSVAEDTPADGDILGIRPYEFPNYDDAYGYTRIDGTEDAIQKYWSEEEYQSAVTDDRFEFRKLLYSSDGLGVVAYIYKPKMVAKPLPTIVFNRGGGAHKDLAPVLVPYFLRLAEQGFVVIAPMFRQTDGGEGIDANGGADLHDLLNILPVIRALSYADEKNIFMTGESRGAMMVYQAIREGFPMRAAAVWGGYTDLQPLIDQQPMLVAYAEQNWPEFGNDLRASIERRSAIYWVNRFDVPVLLMHGESDNSIPVSHTYDLASKLQASGKLYSLIVFADDNHILMRSQQERDRASVRWFRRFSTQAEAEEEQHLRTSASESEINDRGYSLIRHGHVQKAIDVFRIGAQRFPDSLNAHDSLGESLALSGDVAGAVSSYGRALALAEGEDERMRLERILENLNNRE